MKIRLKVLVVILLLLFGSPLTFMYLTVANSTDCNQLVIDTYELHSGINIPDVNSLNCYYDQQTNTRISVYELISSMDLEDFVAINSTNNQLLNGEFLLSENEAPGQGDLYVASGKTWGTHWTYLVDLEANRLYAELQY